MVNPYLAIARTSAVERAEAEFGSDVLWRDAEGAAGDRLCQREIAFIAARDSFYMATVSQTGWPYVQHRGGPPGFLKVLDATTLAFADYRGNRQYVSLGNIATDDRAALILTDYPHRRRLKLYVHIKAVEIAEDDALAARVGDPDYPGAPERILKLELAAFDWNCPQHITPRYTEAEVAAAVRPVRDRLEVLERENRALEARLAEVDRSAR